MWNWLLFFLFKGRPCNIFLQTFTKSKFGLIGNPAREPRGDHGGTTSKNRRSTLKNRRSTVNHAIFSFFPQLDTSTPRGRLAWVHVDSVQTMELDTCTQPAHEFPWIHCVVVQWPFAAPQAFPTRKHLCQSVGLCLTCWSHRTLFVDHTTNMVWQRWSFFELSGVWKVPNWLVATCFRFSRQVLFDGLEVCHLPKGRVSGLCRFDNASKVLT